MSLGSGPAVWDNTNVWINHRLSTTAWIVDAASLTPLAWTLVHLYRRAHHSGRHRRFDRRAAGEP